MNGPVKGSLLVFCSCDGDAVALCAVYEAMSQRLASAGVLAVFLASAFLLYVPYLETFKAFAVEVRLRQSLDRAEEIIGRLKELSVSSAKVSYMTIAWGNRMGTPSAKDRQAILDGVDAQLSALKVDSSERQKIAEPLIRLIGVDLYNVYFQVLDRFLMWKQRASASTAVEGQPKRNLSEEVSE